MNKIKAKKINMLEAKKIGVDGWNRWQCEASTFDWEYPEDETAYFFDGEVIVTTEDEKIHITKEMLVTFPKGLKCTWEVKSHIDKVYTFHFDSEEI